MKATFSLICFGNYFARRKIRNNKKKKQKVAFINAFPSDTFLREFNFTD